MMLYRTGGELHTRFGRDRDDRGRWQVEGWLDHHGEALRRRFDPGSYLALLGAMDSHDVGRGRGAVVAALKASAARITAVGIPGDLLYPDHEVREWARSVGAEYREIRSPHGHDAFLLESVQVGQIVAEALGRVAQDRAAG